MVLPEPGTYLLLFHICWLPLTLLEKQITPFPLRGEAGRVVSLPRPLESRVELWSFFFRASHTYSENPRSHYSLQDELQTPWPDRDPFKPCFLSIIPLWCSLCPLPGSLSLSFVLLRRPLPMTMLYCPPCLCTCCPLPTSPSRSAGPCPSFVI